MYKTLIHKVLLNDKVLKQFLLYSLWTRNGMDELGRKTCGVKSSAQYQSQ